MSYKIHTKFCPSKPRQDWELYNYYFSVVMGKGKMWPSEAWCGASWKKQKQKHKFLQKRKTCVQMEMVLDPWSLMWGLANNPREAPSIALGRGGLSEKSREAETPSAPSIQRFPS